jgi:hypothetical protein
MLDRKHLKPSFPPEKSSLAEKSNPPFANEGILLKRDFAECLPLPLQKGGWEGFFENHKWIARFPFSRG